MMDYYIYLKQPQVFSLQSYEDYCASLGLNIQICPSFKLYESTGFVPMRLRKIDFAEANKDFLTGFEFYSSAYQHVSQSQMEKKGFFKKLFSKKQAEENPFDCLIKDSAFLIELHCGSADSFEVLMAYTFGAYFVKNCGGVFDDPQIGRYYRSGKEIENEIADILNDLREAAKTGQLLTHDFEGWSDTDQ